MTNKEKAIELLEKYNYKKLLKEIEKNENTELIEQILNINFEEVEDAKGKVGKQEEFKNDKIENISYIDENKLSNEEKQKYEKLGKDIISKGKYAVITMAGGQRNKIRTFRTKRDIFDRCKAKT